MNAKEKILTVIKGIVFAVMMAVVDYAMGVPAAKILLVSMFCGMGLFVGVLLVMWLARVGGDDIKSYGPAGN